ncbi:MAG: hypothetical protein PHD34_09070, partial [Methanothrix soehngenii]|nr:hypothetical protein [Methanothrix soehngenii]OPY57146.1 MAG: hypothetical protein A4E49_00099 [Methanosaeta sp. PtaU1.Bin112]
MKMYQLLAFLFCSFFRHIIVSECRSGSLILIEKALHHCPDQSLRTYAEIIEKFNYNDMNYGLSIRGIKCGLFEGEKSSQGFFDICSANSFDFRFGSGHYH